MFDDYDFDALPTKRLSEPTFTPAELAWPEPAPFPFKALHTPAPFPFIAERRRAVFDTECVSNYWLLKFRFIDTNEIRSFAMWPGSAPLDISAILHIFRTTTVIGFNSINYDMPMISYALCGASCEQLKDANDKIIPGGGMDGMKPWEFRDAFGCEMPAFVDHIDIMEVAPGVRVSLKAYMGHIHSRYLQDLPFDPKAVFTPLDRVMTSKYCENDLQGTLDLYNECLTRIQLREELNKQYARPGDRFPFDVRSKSDAQIAEAVIKQQLPFKATPRTIPDGYQFFYEVPAFIKFKSPQLNNILKLLREQPFTVKHKPEDVDEEENEVGEVVKVKSGIIMPPGIKALRVRMGSSVYKFGIGGLHSQEKKRHYYATPNVEISDHDVASYYPSLILMMGMYPEAVGPLGLEIYKTIYHERLAAKAAKRKREADSKKIILNGFFGKLGSKWSVLYAPEQMIQVTITGQLALLMLIESLEDVGIEVISANTDGIVLRTPDGWQATRAMVIEQWEKVTGLQTERTNYSAIFSASVNSYLAFTTEGEVKSKGLYTEPGLQVSSSKAPDRTICRDAVIAYLKDGVPIMNTIKACQDVCRFVTVKNVKGGAVKRRYTPMQKMLMGSSSEPFECEPEISEFLGKVVRFYYKSGELLPINYKSNGNMVSLSMGAEPMMELMDGVPGDIDYAQYEATAVKMLAELGVVY